MVTLLVPELMFYIFSLPSPPLPSPHSHRALEREATAESSAIHQRLEATESLLAEKERELADAREKVGYFVR